MKVLWAGTLVIGLGISVAAGMGANNMECINEDTPEPTPIVISVKQIYQEWIPMPGTGFQSGNGWVAAKELKNFAYERSHNVLTDAEYAAIEKAHGLRMSIGSRHGETLWGYGFPPRIDFNTLYGGVILKNEWLPERLQP